MLNWSKIFKSDLFMPDICFDPRPPTVKGRTGRRCWHLAALQASAPPTTRTRSRGNHRQAGPQRNIAKLWHHCSLPVIAFYHITSDHVFLDTEGTSKCQNMFYICPIEQDEWLHHIIPYLMITQTFLYYQINTAAGQRNVSFWVFLCVYVPVCL